MGGGIHRWTPDTRLNPAVRPQQRDVDQEGHRREGGGRHEEPPHHGAGGPGERARCEDARSQRDDAGCRGGGTSLIVRRRGRADMQALEKSVAGGDLLRRVAGAPLSDGVLEKRSRSSA